MKQPYRSNPSDRSTSVALKPDSEQRDLSRSDSTADGHQHESPEVWGWHAEFGKWAAVAGWISAIILVLMMTSTHYNGQGILFLGLTALALVIGLMVDRQRRKKAWRK